MTQSRTSDPLVCPVRAAAEVIQRLLAEGATSDTHIYQYKDNRGRKKDLTGKVALAILRDYVKTVDKSFGIPANEIGLHSLRASAAMAMYMNGIPVYTIMLLGRWSSDAFLRYIRKQVLEFSTNVSELMILNGTYHHVQQASRDDPRNHNRLSAAANSGMGAYGATINVERSRFGDERSKQAAPQTPLPRQHVSIMEQRDFITDVALVESSASSRLSLGKRHSMPASSSGATTGIAY